MKKFIAAAATAALALAFVPAATATPVFGSSGSSLLGLSSTPATPEQEIRNAIEAHLEHRGYAIDADLTAAAQQYVTANYGPDRDSAYEALFEAGMTSGDGGIYPSNPELITQQFPIVGDAAPSNGRIAAVGIDFGPATTEIMVYFGN